MKPPSDVDVEIICINLVILVQSTLNDFYLSGFVKCIHFSVYPMGMCRIPWCIVMLWLWKMTMLDAKVIVCAAPWLMMPHSTAIPRRWHADLKFLRAPWDCTKILQNNTNNFTFSKVWRCQGAPTATAAFLRRAHSVQPRFHWVLVSDSLRGHGALMACPWRTKSCHYASTACTQRARRVQCVSTASAWIVYEHLGVHQTCCRIRGHA